jgi:CheY-like chemotaxis protein
MLEDEGLQVRSVEHGQEAVRLLQSTRPKAILLDLMLPVMNGWRTVESIRSNPSTQSIPIVAMSASSNVPRPKGCDGFVRKPLTREAILMALRPHVGALLRRH